MARIGIRREDKSRWEVRVPLVPAAIGRLIKDDGVEVAVQTSPTRAFSDEQYKAAGAAIADDLNDCPIILGVKEIPLEKLNRDKTYVYFSHTIKGQAENMPMLERLLELGCNLIDYEKIVNDKGQRLVFFSHFAGIAGMIDSLWALGKRLTHEGIDSPLNRIEQAHRYRDLTHVREAFGDVAELIRAGGLPEAISPLVCGFAGYGQVSRGAQEIYDLLPAQEIAPGDLDCVEPAADVCYKVVFKEEHMVRRVDASSPFDLQEYYTKPQLYEADFFEYIPHLSVLMNCIYWESKYPCMLTGEQLRELYAGPQPKLRVIGDITCDIDGSMECTTHATEPDSPVYVYDPDTGATQDGVAGRGPVVLAVDFLPCEVPVDASKAFSDALLPFIPALAVAEFSKPLSESGLPQELQRAVIVYHGELTEPYRYLQQYVT